MKPNLISRAWANLCGEMARRLPFSPVRHRLWPMREIGGYQIDGDLGAGSYGCVVRGVRDGKRVAIKVLNRVHNLSEVEIKRFLNEGTKLAELYHAKAENIVQFHSFGMTESKLPFIVMEYIANGSVRNLLKKNELVNPWRACWIVAGVARGAARIHKVTGGIHRDIKPDNILLDGDEPKLTDLGIWRMIANEAIPSGMSLTGNRVLCGSLGYSAKEIMDGVDEAIGPWSDVYSLGVVLYELLTGRRPPLDPETVHSKNPILKPSELLPKSSIPTELDDVCMKCLESDWRKRKEHFQDADELHKILMKILNLLPPEAPNPNCFSSISSAGKEVSVRKMLGWTLLLGFLLALAIVVESALTDRVSGDGKPDVTPSPSNPKKPQENFPLTPTQGRQAEANNLTSSSSNPKKSQEISPLIPAQGRQAEVNPGSKWVIRGDELIQENPNGNQMIMFGDPSWGDITYTFKVKKIAGGVWGFSALYHARNMKNYLGVTYGAWGVGDWSSYERVIDGAQLWLTKPESLQICKKVIPMQQGEWYHVSLAVRDNRFTFRVNLWVDQIKQETFRDRVEEIIFHDDTITNGKVGLLTHTTSLAIKDIKVVSREGAVLWDGLPTLMTDAGKKGKE